MVAVFLGVGGVVDGSVRQRVPASLGYDFYGEAGLAVEPSLALDSAATVPFAIPGGLGRRRTGQNLLRCNTSKSDHK